MGKIAVYTHVDKKRYHNHIVINSVNLETGKKYYQHNEFKHVKSLNDKLLKKHGLAIVHPQKHYEKITSPELQLRRRGAKPWKDDIRQKINTVMRDRSTSSYNAFREGLSRLGIKLLDRGQNVSYKLLEGNKKASGRKLGSSYEKETIQRELALRAKRQEERVRQALQHQHTPFPLVSNTNRHQKQQQQHQKMRIRQVRERLRQKTVTLCSDTHWCKFKAPQTLEPSSVLTTPRHKNAHRWPKSNVSIVTPPYGAVAKVEYTIAAFGLLGLALTACKAFDKQNKGVFI